VAPLEPWEKVWIKLSVYQSTDDTHLKDMNCTDCHGGSSEYPNNMEEAHKGFITDPSEMDANGNNACKECHEETVNKYKNSLHQQLYGEKRMVALRSGNTSFDQCAASLQDGFNGECADCHATCGDCHVSIPNSAGKGLISSHNFLGTPDQANNCMACHGSRVAHDFLGDYDNFPFRERDIHREKGFTCLNCHDGEEMHGDVTDADNTHRYNYEHLPSCEQSDCHGNIANVNLYHTVHLQDGPRSLSCYVCHSQDYNNCTACHTAGEWKTDPIYQNNNPVSDFRIGLNPLPNKRFTYVTVRHIPIAPETYDNWGAQGLMTNYDDAPTWKYTSPHSIRRFTARTDTSGGVSCSASCHIVANQQRNEKFFLKQQYIQDNWPNEVNANSSVVVDSELPAGW
jgi:hypothetical protein